MSSQNDTPDPERGTIEAPIETITAKLIDTVLVVGFNLGISPDYADGHCPVMIQFRGFDPETEAGLPPSAWYTLPSHRALQLANTLLSVAKMALSKEEEARAEAAEAVAAELPDHDPACTDDPALRVRPLSPSTRPPYRH